METGIRPKEWSAEELAQVKAFAKAHHAKRTPAQKRKIKMLSFKYQFEHFIDQNEKIQLSGAASILCNDYSRRPSEKKDIIKHRVPSGWDKNIWKRMVNKPYKERLIIASALIDLELDRLNNSKKSTRKKISLPKITCTSIS